MTPEEERRLLRWYPADWTGRYGQELLAMVEDTLDGEPPSTRLRLSLMVAGLHQRLRAGGYLGGDQSAPWRSRAGALLVLAAWAVLVSAGSGFAKATEHWSEGPAGHRGGAVAAAAYATVVVAAWVAAAAVATGMVTALPACWRSWRNGSWVSTRRPLGWAALTVGLAGAATGGLAYWAHHLTSAQRNGGMAWYGVAFVSWAVVLLAVVMTGTRAAFAVERRLEPGPGVVRAQAVAALTAAAGSIVAAAGMVTWWLARSSSTGGDGPSPGASLSWPLIVASVMAAGAAVLAGAGSWRIVGARLGAPGPGGLPPVPGSAPGRV